MTKKTNRKNAAAVVEFKANMMTEMGLEDTSASDAAALNDLLSGLDNAVEAPEVVLVGDDEALEAILEAAVADSEGLLDEENLDDDALFAGGTDEALDEEKVDGEDEEQIVAAEKPKKEKKAKAPKEPKEPSPLRNSFAPPSVKIAAHLGAAKNEFFLLNMGDALLEGEELAARQAQIAHILDNKDDKTWDLAKKEKEKAVMLFAFLKNGGKLNEVMRRAFTVLARDGFLTSGHKGNLEEDLLKKPYSKGTSASQSNQVFGVFPALEICVKSEKGRMVPNLDSLILAKVNDLLSLQ